MANHALDELIAQYLDAVERGELPQREKMLADHPLLADFRVGSACF